MARKPIRTSTVVIPKTGERIKRAFTLRQNRAPTSPQFSTDGVDDEDDEPHAPLLPTRSARARTAAARRHSMNTLGDSFEQFLQQCASFWRGPSGFAVLKCSLAYVIASLAVFLTGSNGGLLFGRGDGKHLIATITVYFHPARSQGSMHKATFLASCAVLYSGVVTMLSMLINAALINSGHTVLAHAVVLLVFCGGGLGLIGWTKQKFGDPLVNVACSLASLTIITLLTREEFVPTGTLSVSKFIQVLSMMIAGIAISTTVSYMIKPVYARDELRDSMIRVTDAFSEALAAITHSFLTGSDTEMKLSPVLSGSNDLKAAFSSLSTHLNETKWEKYFLGKEQEYAIEAELVACMKTLTQSLRGLRNAAETQFALLRQSGVVPTTPSTRSPENSLNSHDLKAVNEWLVTPSGVLSPIYESEADEHDPDSMRRPLALSTHGLPTANQPSEIFERFTFQLGPSMKSLAVTLKQILDDLPFGPAPDYRIAIDSQYRESLSDAMLLYSHARQNALRILYKNKELTATRPLEVAADFEEVAASCGHFSYSLQEFAQDTKNLLVILEKLKDFEDGPVVRNWTWAFFWRGWRARLIGDPESRLSQTSPARPRVQDVKSKKKRVSWSYRAWLALHGFRRLDVKFAVKVGGGAALYALPSLIPETRGFYAHWRGEWGLLSYMLVCSMTIGASNTTGLHRLFGTCLGAVCAIVAWICSDSNPVLLGFFGWLMSLGCFWIIVIKKDGPFGRFILLTYNLTALYAYSLSARDDDDDDDEGGTSPIISEIALHRVIAVLSGVIWGLVVSRFVWPVSARRKVRDGLSILWFRMSLLWKRDPLSALLEGESSNEIMNLKEEFALNQYLTQLETIRMSASSEYHLKGPFPDEVYVRLLRSSSRILDALHAMNLILMKEPEASEGEALVLKATEKERQLLSSRLSHLLQVLASSMRLKYCLGDVIPNTESPRDRLLAKIFEYRRTAKSSQEVLDEDFALIYAYTLVTGQIAYEIEGLYKEVENLFDEVDEDLLKLE